MVYLSKEEVESINSGNVPAMQYMKGTLEWDEDYNYYWAPCTGSRVMKEKKVSPQDLAICEYSGLRPVEGYKEKEINKREDKDFMYKWIRERSGK